MTVLLLVLSLLLWSSQQDDAQIQMKFNVILYPFKVEGQCLVILQSDVLKNVEHYSQFGFFFFFLLLLLKHEFRPFEAESQGHCYLGVRVIWLHQTEMKCDGLQECWYACYPCLRKPIAKTFLRAVIKVLNF